MKLLQRLKRGLQLGLAGDLSLLPQGQRAGGEGRNLLVIAARPIPTLDYYLRALLREHPSARIVYDAELERWHGPAAVEAVAPDTRVILVRMPSSRWARVIADAGPRVCQVSWLIDDDVAAAKADAWLPRDYRSRLLGDYLRFRRDFSGLIDRVWASTPRIAARFPAERVELHPPRAIAPEPISRWVTIFYHGTGAHRRELDFLLPIFEEVQASCRNTIIEVVGDHALYQRARRVPRMRVLHPLVWPDYLAILAAGKYDIGLAPLLETPFNLARSGIKALEIASIGAQGVLSDRPPYTDYAHLPGIHLVGDEPSAWRERILALVAGFDQRSSG